MKPRYLLDKSALARMTVPQVQARLGPILEAGEAATCAIVELEVLYSARNAAAWRETRRRRALAYTRVTMDEAVLERAIEVQGQLADIGHHRVPIPDLLIAATGEAHGLTVLHYDADFDVISRVTGQPMEWVVPRGTL